MATISQTMPGAGAKGEFVWWNRIKTPLFYGVLLLWTILSVTPFLFSIVFSFKPINNLYTPPFWWPNPFTLDNYRTILGQFKDLFPRWVLNSALISGVLLVIRPLFCAMSGYAFARLRFPGRKILFNAMLFSMMIPGQVLLIPNFLLIGPGVIKNLQVAGLHIPTGFGLLDNLLGVILPGIVDAFGVFMMAQFYQSIPKELEEAAYIDGASRFTTFFRVILPISQTTLITLALFTFQGTWNAFMWPLLVLRTPTNFTLPIGLQWFRGEYYSLYSVILAGSLFNTIPVLIIFFLFQKYFIRSIASTGSKEG